MSNIIRKKSKNSYQGGFTLVEMAIVIAILGLLIGGGLSFYKPLDQNIRTTETKERMARVANAMSSFALRNNRIPCPADPMESRITPAPPGNEPFGSERGSGTTGVNTGSCTATQSEGIVPYRTLGLRQEDVIDGYGSYFTYRVSPAFTNQNGGSNTVQDHCRDENWISGGSNVNPDKARFCCPSTGSFGIGTDVIVTDSSGLSVMPPRTTDANNMDTVDTTPDGNALTVAYVLVSHGSNRYGKFLIGSTTPTDKYTQTDVFGTGEAENQDGDINFVDNIEVSAETNAYFDDIILWRSQDSLMSELGTNTCAVP